ncbi:hypothetical protein CCZ27_12645 [Thauera sinica]|nr:hypothetical protein CCZ27_12645 [Thauera sp. K11]
MRSPAASPPITHPSSRSRRYARPGRALFLDPLRIAADQLRQRIHFQLREQIRAARIRGVGKRSPMHMR